MKCTFSSTYSNCRSWCGNQEFPLWNDPHLGTWFNHRYPNGDFYTNAAFINEEIIQWIRDNQNHGVVKLSRLYTFDRCLKASGWMI